MHQELPLQTASVDSLYEDAAVRARAAGLRGPMLGSVGQDAMAEARSQTAVTSVVACSGLNGVERRGFHYVFAPSTCACRILSPVSACQPNSQFAYGVELQGTRITVSLNSVDTNRCVVAATQRLGGNCAGGSAHYNDYDLRV
eukprot:365252-Chlamydomonas_euryale.AAC.44